MNREDFKSEIRDLEADATEAAGYTVVTGYINQGSLRSDTTLSGPLRTTVRRYARLWRLDASSMKADDLRDLWNATKEERKAMMPRLKETYPATRGRRSAPKKTSAPTTSTPAPSFDLDTDTDTKPAPQPAPTRKPDTDTDNAAELLDMMRRMLGATVDEGRVIELIKAHAPEHAKGPATRVEVVTPTETRTVEGLHHKVLPTLIKTVNAGVHVLMVGPAGSGKTTIGAQVAEALGVPFYFNGALSSEFKLSGFIDAQGRIVSTAFREAFCNGGLYLFDEIDASMPDALLAFNAALANGHADFPDGAQAKHPNFRCMAAANTFGRGADRVYVGRNQLDGASLDRFATISVDYDEELELALAGPEAADWVRYVQRVRAAVWDLSVRHVVSPRASMNGARLIAAGIPYTEVADMVLWKGLDRGTVEKIKESAQG